MSSRDFILQAVRRNQPASRPLPAVPKFPCPSHHRLTRFGAALTKMGGTLVVLPAQMTVAQVIADRFSPASVICSAVPEVAGVRSIGAITDPRALEDVDIGVVRAAFGVAETGSVALGERQFGINALGFLPQHLVVLLDPATLVDSLHDAYGQSGFFNASYAVFMSGPSATADIEGVLVRGAQGIRSLTVIAL
jgi:L-lactate dehydrogenase complex protein LldG